MNERVMDFLLSLGGANVKKVESTSKRIALFVSLLLLIGLPFSAYANADEGTTGATGDTTEVIVASEQDGVNATQPVESSSPDTAAVSEPRVPLVMRPHETGWALSNLLASLLTIIISVSLVFRSTIRRDDHKRVPEGFGLTIFSMSAAIMTTILFTSTGDIHSQMVVFDSLTAAHVALLAVSILCTALSMKKNATIPFSGNRSL
jgi:hypothetical protein